MTDNGNDKPKTKTGSIGNLSADTAFINQFTSSSLSLNLPKSKVGPTMAMDAKFTLHTKLAMSLWRGRPGKPQQNIAAIPGLLRFANESGNAWFEASLNNPVADMYLILAEERYEKALDLLNQSKQVLDFIFDGQSTFEDIGVMTNTKPFTQELRFRCPWGYVGARILKQYDDIVRTALTAKHIGFISDDDWYKLVVKPSQKIRGFFQSFDAYLNIPLDRDWLKDHPNSNRLKRVHKHYSFANRELPEIPKDIYTGQRRAKLSPSIKSTEERERLREARGPMTNEEMASLVKQMPKRSAERAQARKEHFKNQSKIKAKEPSESTTPNNKNTPAE